MEATLSTVFARSDYFALWNTETDTIRFESNPFKKLDEHVGDKVLGFLSDYEVSRVIAGSFGTLVQNKAQELNIQMIVFDRGDNKLTDILDLLRHSLNPSATPKQKN